MSAILKAIFENESLKEDVKVLLVKHGYYKEARELMERQIIVDISCDTNKISNQLEFLNKPFEYPIKPKVDKDLVIKTEPITMLQDPVFGELLIFVVFLLTLIVSFILS